MKKLHSVMMPILLAGVFSDDYNPLDETEEQKQARLKPNKEQFYKNKGLKKFTYGEKQLWALNQKSADKKAKRLGLNI